MKKCLSRETTTCSRRYIPAGLESIIAVPSTTMKGVNGQIDRFLENCYESHFWKEGLLDLPVNIHLD